MFSSLIEIFCLIDDFCKLFNQNTFLPDDKKRNKQSKMTLSEVMTILLLFHKSDYKTFKHFYLDFVLNYLKTYFPKTVGYSRFVQMIPSALMPLVIFFHGIQGRETERYFVDSTTIEVCHIKRERQHKVFKGIAVKSKSTKGWFFGFKLHLIINHFRRNYVI